MVGLKGRTYEEKLAELGMRTLENRRKRLDLVQILKIIKGIDKVESNLMFNSVEIQDRFKKAFFPKQNCHTLELHTNRLKRFTYSKHL